PDSFRSTAHQVVDTLADYLGRAQRREMPVLELRDPDELLAAWDRPFAAQGLQQQGADLSLASLLHQLLTHSNHLHHPGYIGHQISVPIPDASVLEMVNALLSNGMAVFEMGQLQTVMERRVVEFLAQTLGFDSDAGGVLTHGGSLGNFTALLAARQAMAEYDIWTEGQGCPMAVLVSEQAHYCIARAVQSMGWGAKGAWKVRVNSAFQLDASDLQRALKEAQAAGRQVIAVVGSACSTATGSFDPLDKISDFCRDHGLWFHVDGAHGASLALSTQHRGRLRGIEHADSVVWDLHKMMGLPALSTAVLFREQRRSHEAFAQEAGYLFEPQEASGPWYQLGLRTMECTKRGMSVTAYCMLQVLGTDWFAAQVDRLLELTQTLRDMLTASDDFELACEPEANITCFRHLNGTTGLALDHRQERVRSRLIAEGQLYIVQTRLADATWLRVTVMNPLTTQVEFDLLLDTIRSVE
ncbi:MAG: L-2,4-diaminobutyrate decarboxylase, partial [Planctomycetota bacterium]